MPVKLKRVSDQVIVITGASSGIGLATAEMAVQRGARVVLAARSEEELRDTCERLNRSGKRATYVAADVADEAQVLRIADHAVAEFGGFDTWVNNAGISIYGKLLDVPMAEKRRVFGTNFWGLVYGCKAAVKHLRDRGGCIINVGSEVSDIAIPLQGIYSASKHAVKGYSDALRMELEHDRIPIAVTLVKPSAINTPYPEHARNYLEDGVPALPPPLYAPEVVAEAILRCAEKPVRDVFVGGAGRMQVALGHVAPRITDAWMERSMFKNQKAYDRTQPREGSLDSPQRDGRAYGPHRGHVMKSSAYTKAALSDTGRVLPFIAAGAVLIAGVRRWRAA